MNEPNKSSPSKGDFIDLEKNQYKNNNKIKKYFIIFFSFLIISILIIFYLNNFSLKKIISQNIEDRRLTSSEVVEETTYKKERNDDFNTQIILLNENLDFLKEEAADNANKLSIANKKISDLTQKLTNYEARKLVNSEFYYAEKYIILNSLLSLKNKFERRQNFKKELDNLISIFNNKPEVKSTIINLQGLEISNVVKAENLVDRLNAKINFYDTEIDRFINTNFDKTSLELNEIISSRENFANYIKSILNSTYKVTRVNDHLERGEKIPYEIYNFRKILENAKEYLIIGNLRGALEIFKLSNFDDREIDIWVLDASKLYDAQEKLRSLEYKLLEIIGEKGD